MKKLISFLSILVLLVTLSLSYPTASAKTNFKVTSTSTTNSVKLKWNKVKGAKYYKIYRKTANTKYKLVCKKTTKKTFTNKKLKSNKKYTYKVKAFKKNKKGKFYSFASAVKTIKTKKVNQPQTFTTTSVTTTTTTTIPTTQTTMTNSFAEELKKLQAHYSNLSNEEKLNMFEKEFGYEIPKTAEVVELELSSYSAYIEGAWGYSAKIKLDDADYSGLYEMFYNHFVVSHEGVPIDINEAIQSEVEYFSEVAVSYNGWFDWWKLSKSEIKLGKFAPKGETFYNPRPGCSELKMQVNYYSFLVQDENNKKYLYISTPIAKDFVTHFNEEHSNV